MVDAVDGRASWGRQGHRGADLAGEDLQPWKVDTFKISTDPDFEAKLVDVVGLYLNPPERAVVFSFDEKTQCQALDRTQPSLPLKPGRARTMTHDYKRNGTTDLFAAMNVATGEVLDTRPGTGPPAMRSWRSSSSSTSTSPAISTCTWSWTTSPRTSAPDVAEWLAHPSRRVGICTSRRRRRRG